MQFLIDMTILTENWWIILPAFLAFVCIIGLFAAYLRRKKAKKKESTKETRYSEEMKENIINLMERIAKIEKEFIENIPPQLKGLGEQMRNLERTVKEHKTENKPVESDTEKKSARLLNAIHLIFPQIKLLEKLEQYSQLSLTADEIGKIISEILEKTRMSPYAIDVQSGEDRKNPRGIFEEGIITQLSHKMYDIEKSMHVTVGDEKAYVVLGNVQYEKGDFIRAKDYYLKALTMNQSYSLARCNLGASLLHMNKYEEALGEFEKTLENEPYHAKAWHGKGIVLVRLDRYEEALSSFGKAVELIPNDARIWHSSGVVLANLGRYEEALKAYENAIELNPDSPDTWYNKGVTLIQLGLHEKALKAYEHNIRLKPDSYNAWYNKGLALGRLGRYEDALMAYEKAIYLKSDFTDALYNKACLHAFTGDKEKALKDLKKAILLNPDYRNTAGEDDDFRSLAEDEDFKRILNN